MCVRRLITHPFNLLTVVSSWSPPAAGCTARRAWRTCACVCRCAERCNEAPDSADALPDSRSSSLQCWAPGQESSFQHRGKILSH